MHYRIILFISFFAISLATTAQKEFPPERPTLIVKIIIDQFRQDYLFSLQDRFSEGGFKRLQEGGSICHHATYNFSYSGSAPDITTIATGALPNDHGIVADTWLDRNSFMLISSISDAKCFTINEQTRKEGFSAAKMLASTLGDQLRLSNFGKSKSITIAMDKKLAILSGDHSSSGTYWLGNDGKFATSSYYASWLPNWVDEFNLRQFPDFYLDSEWEPLFPMNTYLRSKYEDRMYKTHGFPYKLSSLKGIQPNYSTLEHTPMGNMLVKDMAIAAIKNEQLGEHDVTDILNITFSANAYHANTPGPQTVETEDIILRLDREIESLLTFLDKTIGQTKYLVVLTATRGALESPEQLAEFNIPSGKFSPDRALALLNSYLMAIYGQGKWVTGYQAQQVYLNRDLIEKSDISLSEFQDKTTEFLSQFSGISKAIPSHVLNNRAWPSGYLQLISNSYFAARSGDIFLVFEPGWSEEGTESALLTMGRGASNRKVPIIFYGWKIGKKTISIPIHVSDIAPTLSHLLHIDPPNAATGVLINEMLP